MNRHKAILPGYLHLVMVVCLAIKPSASYAQLMLNGKITDATTGESLPGATIYLPALLKGTITNNQGIYQLNDIPTGVFEVKYSFLGYKSQLLHLHIRQDTTVNVALMPEVKEFKEVVITGSSHAMELKASPLPVNLLRGRELFAQQANNLVDALSHTPGIEQVSTGPAISKPVIRGLTANRVLVLYNGLRQEGQQWGDEHGLEIDEMSVDRVEILKGPGSLEFGSDALAGVINLIPPHKLDSGRIAGELASGYQTNNREYLVSAMLNGHTGNINWLGRLSHKRAGSYQNKADGRVFNSGYNQLAWELRAGINKKWGFAHFYLTRFGQQLGLPEGARDSTGRFTREIVNPDGSIGEITVSDEELGGYHLFVPYQQVDHWRLGTNINLFLGDYAWQTKVEYQRNDRQEFGEVAEPTTSQLHFRLHTINYNSKLMLPERNHWQLAAGISGMAQINNNLAPEKLLPEYNLLDAGAYFIAQKIYNRVTLRGGLRFDNRHIDSHTTYITDSLGNDVVKFTPFRKDFFNYSISAGLSYQSPGGINYKLNVGRGFRAPNLAELSANGVHEGSFRYEYGNLNLLPETSWQADLGLSWESDHIDLQAAVFYNLINHFTYLRKLLGTNGNDSIPLPDEPQIKAFQYTQNTAALWGGEFALDLHPHPADWLHFKNSFALVYGQQINQSDSLKYLPFIPAPRWTAELQANLLPQAKRWHHTFIRANLVYYLAQNRVLTAYNTETPTPDYGLLNAAIGTTLTSKTGRTLLEIIVLANNLLDATYQNHLSRLKYADINPATGRMGIFGMGRNFSVKLKIPFTLR